jgi:hypothetical protein
MNEGGKGKPAVVRDAENADLAVGLGDVVDKPLDRVVGVGALVDRRGILRAVHGAVHHVVTLGTVLAANVLNDADVAAADNHVRGVVVAVDCRPQMRAGSVTGLVVGAVGRAREQDGRVGGAFRDENHRVQVDSIAHGDHGIAALVIEGGCSGLELIGRLAGVVGILGCGSLGACESGRKA